MTEINEAVEVNPINEGDQIDLSEAGTEGIVGTIVGAISGGLGGFKMGEAKTIKRFADATGKSVAEVKAMIKPQKPKKEKGKIAFRMPVYRKPVEVKNTDKKNTSTEQNQKEGEETNPNPAS